MAEDEKKPSNKSNSLALLKPSTKKSSGSQSEFDLYPPSGAQIALFFSIDTICRFWKCVSWHLLVDSTCQAIIQIKQFAHITSSPNKSASVDPLFLSRIADCLLIISSLIFRMRSGFTKSAKLSP